MDSTTFRIYTEDHQAAVIFSFAEAESAIEESTIKDLVRSQAQRILIGEEMSDTNQWACNDCEVTVSPAQNQEFSRSTTFTTV